MFKNGSVQRKTYIYLGIEQNHDTGQKNAKEKLNKEYLRRWRLVFDAELNTKNKVQTNGSMAVPVLRHSSGILNWRAEELQKLDRKLLTFDKQHHPKACIDRWCVARKQSGRGLMQLEGYTVQVPKLMEYVKIASNVH
jgi:hypothetical protein